MEGKNVALYQGALMQRTGTRASTDVHDVQLENI